MEHGDMEMMWRCDDRPFPGGGGSWIGHIFPGLLLFVWATHWTLGMFRSYFESQRSKNGQHQAQAHYVLFCLPNTMPYTLLEPVVKATFPLIAMLLELWLAHKGGYRNIVCEEGTPRAGHIVPNHINNWQHAMMYPGIIMSGFVDLLSYKMQLPDGTSHVFLAMAFVMESLLMGLHKKHEPLDEIVHLLLFWSMLACAIFVLLEIKFRNSFLVSAGRCAALYLQATWFFTVARIMFEGRVFWDAANGDMAPAMYVPVLFTQHIYTILAGMVAIYLAYAFYYQRKDQQLSQLGSGNGHSGLDIEMERKGLLDDENKEPLPLSVLVKNGRE